MVCNHREVGFWTHLLRLLLSCASSFSRTLSCLKELSTVTLVTAFVGSKYNLKPRIFRFFIIIQGWRLLNHFIHCQIENIKWCYGNTELYSRENLLCALNCLSGQKFESADNLRSERAPSLVCKEPFLEWGAIRFGFVFWSWVRLFPFDSLQPLCYIWILFGSGELPLESHFQGER